MAATRGKVDSQACHQEVWGGKRFWRQSSAVDELEEDCKDKEVNNEGTKRGCDYGQENVAAVKGDAYVDSTEGVLMQEVMKICKSVVSSIHFTSSKNECFPNVFFVLYKEMILFSVYSKTLGERPPLEVQKHGCVQFVS